MTTRRGFIRIAGSTAVIAAAGTGLGACAEIPPAANAPWRAAGAPADIRRKLLSYAILAPNPHNRQPWLVDLSEPDAIALYCDRTRLLPETDPFGRQILIGHGCFLGLLELAAGAHGYRAEIAPFPAGPFGERIDRDVSVARIRLVAAQGQSDPLFRHALVRRSNKKPFDRDRPVEAEKLAAIAAAGSQPGFVATASAEAGLTQWLRGATNAAYDIEIKTPRTFKESVDLMRIGRGEIERHRDGISLGGTMIEIAALLGQVSRESIADPASSDFRRGLERGRDQCQSAMGFAWLVSARNGRAEQLAAGRAYLRMNLKATELGLAMQPLSQGLQEFPEMAGPHRDLHARLAPQGGTVQMLARIGYGVEAPASPRRALADVLRPPLH